MAKSGLGALRDEATNDRRLQSLVEKNSGELRDRVCSLEEANGRLKDELKARLARNEELEMELKDAKAQLRARELKLKKLTEENAKLAEDRRVVATDRVFYQRQQVETVVGTKPQNEQVAELRRQVRLLEEKLKRQSAVAERPYEEARSRSPEKREKEVIVRTVTRYEGGESAEAVRRECEQWKTRYNFVVNENAVLANQNKEMEAELKRFQSRVEGSAAAMVRENRELRLEVERLGRAGGRSVSPSKGGGVDVVKLRKEVDRLKE